MPAPLRSCAFDGVRDGLLAGFLGLVLEQSRDAGFDEAVLPAPDAGLGELRLAHDRHDAQPLGGEQDDPRPLDDLLGHVAIRRNGFEPRTILARQHDFGSLACHPTAESYSRHKRIQMFVTEH